MKISKIKMVFRAVFVAWVAIWFLFLIRSLVKGEARDYKNLFGKSLEEKRAYVTGEEFYEFILFCKKIIPEDSNFKIQANYDTTMDYFRFAYYMYPAIRNLDDPEYIACYKVKFNEKGYKLIDSLSDEKYILKKR